MRCIAFILMLAVAPTAIKADEIDYNRDIRPVLSDKCFACHGPDEKHREGGFRLDQKEGALAKAESGERPIVPSDVSASEVVKRIVSKDEDERMPPADSNKKLSPEEVALIRQWIEQGAEYQPHWAFVSPSRKVLPRVSNAEWPANAIDHFILARLDREGLKPSPPAGRERLLRRLTFDLTGLPPTVAEMDAFLADTSAQAVERVIDSLLGRTSYGEHMAVNWLDAARYADTNGYNNDPPRYNWRWRDWAIEAFNRNLPFDQFLTEQLAGDLIPGATVEQQLATGFNRNHSVTTEGGVIDEEYRLEYVADRVNTTATVFMGLSIRCARCHDHKFDPILQKEYYAFSAFFNQVPETGFYNGPIGNPKPVISVPTKTQRAAIEKQTTALQALASSMQERRLLADSAIPDWQRRLIDDQAEEARIPAEGLLHHCSLEDGEVSGNPQWVLGKVGKALKLDGKTHVVLPKELTLKRDQPFSYGAWVNPGAARPMNILSRMNSGNNSRGFDLTFEKGPVSVHLIHQWPDNGLKVQTKAAIKLNEWTHVFATYDGSSKASGVTIYFNGVKQPLDIKKDKLSASIVADVEFRIGSRTNSIPFVGMLDDVRLYASVLPPSQVALLAGNDSRGELLAIPTAQRSEAQHKQLQEIYLGEEDAEFTRLAALHRDQQAALKKVQKAVPTAMIMKDQAKARSTFVLMRGDYDKPGEKVEAATPVAFGVLPAGAPRNRLGLARWLTNPRHPLTARVAVNRLWYQMFGTGIVETQEDFGSQGSWPSHPQLLDWLAVEYIESGWDSKAMIKLITMSSTYQQSPRSTPALRSVDPRNLLLARGPRSRLSAEMIRDHALAVSGFLTNQVGGPSVRPYQPAGLWTEVSVGGGKVHGGGRYVQDHGKDLYRRGIYTWWKRTCPPPALNTFDAPDREFCTVRRTPTNTPLQALVMLNDPTFVEAARGLAQRLLREAGTTVEARAAFAFRLATSRSPRPRELAILTSQYVKQHQRFEANKSAAVQLLAIGDSDPTAGLDTVELAAWTTVASIVLNLDEAISR
jgi:mono/diheme cytochrome c family protein